MKHHLLKAIQFIARETPLIAFRALNSFETPDKMESDKADRGRDSYLKQFTSFLIICMLLTTFPSFSEELTQVTECDTLTRDLLKTSGIDSGVWGVSAGIWGDNIDVSTSMAACAAAVAENPSIVRFHFMYGRALFAAKHYEEAATQFLFAADNDDIASQNALGMLYNLGFGVPQSLDKAVYWFRKTAELGNENGMYGLGFMYLKGRSVPQDYAEAARWFSKAAAKNNIGAQFALGSMYYEGKGFPNDNIEAFKWFRKAAENNYTPAQINLAFMYEKGQGVVQDLQLAIDWYRKAAENGLSQAQIHLGTKFEAGDDVPQDYVEAYKWFSIVTVSHDISLTPQKRDEAARRLDALARKMTSSQISRAQQLVAAFIASNSNRSGPSKSTKSVALNTQKAPPQIVLTADNFEISTQAADISGKIQSTEAITSFTIDGKNAPYQPDGTFNFSRTVTIGQNSIKLQVINEWGQSTEAIVRVKRTLPPSPNIIFPPLDPSLIKAKQHTNSIALIIGVDQYKNMPPAEFAENDARAFYDYATNALGVPRDRIKLLTGADAQRLDIQKSLRTWLKPLVIKGQTDVFVFFSGHGLASDDGKNLYLMPYDGDSALLTESSIRRNEMIDAVAEAGAASATFFLDTCYSGGTRGKESLVISARPILIAANQETVPSNVTIFAAAGNNLLFGMQ